MCDTPFKTPLPYNSDSEESVASTESAGSTGTGTTSSGVELSIVAAFDDLMRFMRQKRCDEVEDAFLDFAEQTKRIAEQYHIAVTECKRLQNELDTKIHQNSDLENKLTVARKLLDQEKRRTRQVERERDQLEVQIGQVRDLLIRNKENHFRLPDETREKLAFLSNTSRNSWEGIQNGNVGPTQLSAIPEVNSTGSILSDFSYSRSEDDLDNSLLQCGKTWKKHRPSTGGIAEPAIKKRRSSGNKVVEITTTDIVRATTTLTVNKEGPITASSIIESIPKNDAPKTRKSGQYSTPSAPPANLVFESWARESPRVAERNNNLRPHTFQQKTVVMPDTCGPCEKRIRFGRTAMKCKDCRALCHVECKDMLPVPCIPVINTPNQRHFMGVIGDYTPTIPPMVPGLIIHCVNEIELRGLNEIGLYRIPGAERDVKALKEKFLKGRGAPCLNQVDIHVICGTVKDFLRSLTEPLVTYKLWKDFIKAVQVKDKEDIRPALCEAISELPQPNRDTLAYLMLHLQKVSQAPECKMPISNLAKVFGPTIIGYSSEDPDPQNLISETVQQSIVMEYLLHLSTDYWSGFINVDRNTLQPGSRLQQTPSTDSLLRHTTRGLITPSRTGGTRRKQRFFATPPTNK